MRIICLVVLASLSQFAFGGDSFETCRSKLMQAQKLDVLYDLDWKSGRVEPRVVVGPTFMTMTIDAKEGFAETVNCFLMAGEAGKCVNFNLLHWQSGKPVGAFRNCRYRPR